MFSILWLDWLIEAWGKKINKKAIGKKSQPLFLFVP